MRTRDPRSNPLVIVDEDDRPGWWIAECAHCPWTYRNAVKTDVAEQAKRHRADHRAGRVKA